MADHDPPAADDELFGQNAVDVASRIAAYVATNHDAGNWSPQRWAYEAVMVILNDQGAAHDVLRCMAGQTAYDLTVVDDDILAERDALAAEVERLRTALAALREHILTDGPITKAAVAALTEEVNDG